jgi:hypothetical protein
MLRILLPIVPSGQVLIPRAELSKEDGREASGLACHQESSKGLHLTQEGTHRLGTGKALPVGPESNFHVVIISAEGVRF